MEIALAFDRTFARYALATFESVTECGSPDARARWWFMPGADVPEATLETMTRWARERAVVNVLQVPTELDSLPLSSWRIMSSRISNAAYYRLMLPDLVPKAVERVLYLDCDVMCTGDLSSLWHTDLGGALLGAVVDPTCPTVSAAGGIPGFVEGDQRLTFWSDYFNSGVLLMDLPRCRDGSLAKQSLMYLREHASRLRFAVQDAMNLSVDDQWHRLDGRWNDVDFAGYEQAIDGDRDPRIIHFAGRRKPWQPTFPDGEVRARYERHLECTPDLTLCP